MFGLSDVDLRKPVLGCADGPADFNFELTRRGGTVASVDPLFEYTADEIRRRIDDTFDEVMGQTRQNSHEFIWRHVRSVEELGRIRMNAMQRFLSDYTRGKKAGRYRPESLPSLAFADDQFELALCSHFLFLYSDSLDLEFHIASIREMCRVAGEARVFPLLQLGSIPSPHVAPVTDHFRQAGYQAAIVRVPYEFQRGGNEMLRIRKVEPIRH